MSKLLTDNGKEFTDRLFASKEHEPSGENEFDQLCQELGIEHRLTKPRTPRNNGMVERFNGRIADVLKTHRFNSRAKVEHPFRVLKQQFGYVKVRYRGLKKNTAQIVTLFALSNLWMARHKLLPWGRCVREGRKARN